MFEPDTHQFEADVEDGPWMRCALWDSEDPLGPINGESFELGEPITLNDIEFVSLLTPPQGPTGVWWIQEFYMRNSGRYVALGADRDGPATVRGIGVLRMAKLNAMERIAAEYAF